MKPDANPLVAVAMACAHSRGPQASWSELVDHIRRETYELARLREEAAWRDDPAAEAETDGDGPGPLPCDDYPADLFGAAVSDPGQPDNTTRSNHP